jgi:predicted nuclease of predicted toxin-antitoxin system
MQLKKIEKRYLRKFARDCDDFAEMLSNYEVYGQLDREDYELLIEEIEEFELFESVIVSLDDSDFTNDCLVTGEYPEIGMKSKTHNIPNKLNEVPFYQIENSFCISKKI